MERARVLVTGLWFPESPRHGPDGRCYVSDQLGHEVLAVDLTTGARTTICRVPGQPSGLGWLPDGDLLVVSMTDRVLLRVGPDGATRPYASLADIAGYHANDMLVDRRGRAYVGNFGFDLHGRYGWATRRAATPGLRVPTATLAVVDVDGVARAVAEDLEFPNGMVELPGDVLVVAETLGSKLTAYDIGADGALSGRRVWADLYLRLVAPDGICADADGGIWVANATRSAAVRVVAGGRITDMVRTSQKCFAVGLSGLDRRTLVCCTAPTSMPRKLAAIPLGRLETARVSIPGV
jgi:sugar lactone lactonase YvrE